MIQDLIKLIVCNPELEVLPMVYSDVVPSDDYNYWNGSIGKSRIDKYICIDDRIYFYDEDFEELIDDWIDYNYEDYPGKSTDELSELAKVHIRHYDWTTAIIVNIELP